MRFSAIRSLLKNSLNATPEDCIDLIQAHALPLRTHPSFTVNFAHKIWMKAFKDENWNKAVQTMGVLGFTTCDPFMWVKKSLKAQKHDLACITHQYANYPIEKNKNLAIRSLALYAQSPLLKSALCHTSMNLSYIFEKIPYHSRYDEHFSNHQIENKTLAHNLLEGAPIDVVYEIMAHNNHVPSKEEWGALVSSSRIKKHPVIPFELLLNVLTLDQNNGDFAVECMINANNTRWLQNPSEEHALDHMPSSNPHLKYIKEVVEHLRSQKIRSTIMDHLQQTAATTPLKRKI